MISREREAALLDEWMDHMPWDDDYQLWISSLTEEERELIDELTAEAKEMVGLEC